MMINDHFTDLCPVPGSVDREESMHLAVEPNSFYHVPFISFQGTAKVVERNTGNERNQLIGQDTRKFRWI